MARTTMELSTFPPEVWVQREGAEPMTVPLEPHMRIIDHVKAKVFVIDHDKYQTLFGQQRLTPGSLIPTDTSEENPLKFERISNLRHGKFFLSCCASKRITCSLCLCNIFIF